MGVKLKMDTLKDNRKSLFLEIYLNKDKTKRKGLKLYLSPDNSQEAKSRNKEVLRQAEILRNQVESELLKRRFGQIDPKEKYDFSFLEFFQRKVDERLESGINYQTWYSVNKHLNNYTGGKMLFSELSENWLVGMRSYLTKRLSQNSSHTYFNKIKRAVHDAFRENLIEFDFADLVKSPKMVNPEREFLTENELKKLVHAKCRKPIMKKAFLFAVYTGLRWSDIQNLKWQNLILSDGQWYLQFTTKKTKNAEFLPVNEEAISMLGDKGEPEERVFQGLKYSADNNRHLGNWVIMGGVNKHITFHCARHTHAVLLLSKGVDIYTVCKMLGHENVATTQIYAKLLDESKIEASSKIKGIIETSEY